MIPRTVYGEEHEIFRRSVRAFVEREIEPYHAEWEDAGEVPREVWLKAGAAGLLLCSVPEEYGGAGADFLFSAVVIEELARIGATGPGFGLHSEIVAPYILHYGSEEQKRTWLPRMARGEVIGAIAMTEPTAGSDLQAIRTTAIADGDDYVINGQKVFITNGYLADLVIVVTKTDPEMKAKGTSLILVEAERAGFDKGRKLNKIGFKAQDTAELFFNDVRVPKENRLGEEGSGFAYLMRELAQERLTVAIRCASAIEAALDGTIAYTKERQAFGRPIAAFQNTRFELAELKAEAVVARVFVDRCMDLHLAGGLDADTAAVAKLHLTELQCRLVDRCLQLHGGYGYMWEYPIARAYADARMARIAGGTSEIMKEIIARTL